MEKVITGNYAASYGAKLARAQVIAAYPITPQTSVIEKLAALCADGELDARFIKVESEHSAMAACIGASATGARAFTATSGQGLLLMHEVVHWAAGARLPIVMAVINRAVAPGWNIWTDQNDTLSQRDTGWMQFYCEGNQEVLDTIIQAYKVAEQVLLPAMVILDAFVLSHTSEIVDIPDQALVDEYLPPYEPPYRLNVNDPHAFGGLAAPGEYMEFRYKMQRAMEEAKKVAREADEEFGRLFGRRYGLVEGYRLDDAEVVLVTSGTVASTSRDVIDDFRERGIKVGMLKIRLFRPFPAEEVRESLRKARKVAVIDRNISFGHGGIFAQEIKSVLYNAGLRTPLFGFIAGLGGRDVTPQLIGQVLDYTLEHDEPPADIIWMGVKR
ncbi:MAG TPA: pyruvate ferredoxin oxidoreductase [Chloroflexi bacterium]|nr:pyruvate ferredoxin oxidoreductase [Chloroflexota bacterium]